MTAKPSPVPPLTKREEIIEKEMIRITREKAVKHNKSKIKGFNLKPLDVKTELNFRASEKTITAVANKSLNFNIDNLGAIESNFTNATIKYTVDGAQEIYIDGIKRDNPQGTALGVKLYGYGYFFELTIVSNKQWIFTTSSIVTTEGDTRTIANPPISGFGNYKAQIETV